MSLTRVQLGSGDKFWPGWVNVDKHNTLADVNCDCIHTTLASDSADEIQAIHLLEHLHRMNAPIALRDWFRVLKPGGKLVLEMPCLDKIAALIVAGDKNLRNTVMGLYGDPRDPKPGMQHQWGWSFAELYDVMEAVGYAKIEQHEPRFHIRERDMRVEAVKPLTT